MHELYDGLILYHGSYCEVRNPDLLKCSKRKDFGQGFYLTSSKEQATSFLKTSIAKAVAKGDIANDQNFGYISEFEIKLNSDIKSYIFEKADADWLHCIAAHRRKGSFPLIEEEMARYDVIIGKIADDQTNTTLAAYISGAFGVMGDDEADTFCIKQLLPEKLQNQYCFKTETAITCLEFKGSEKIWLQK